MLSHTPPPPPQDRTEMKMSEVEEEFLHAVDFGDVVAVREILEEFPNLNVDCTDALGRTPLRLAVKNENKEMVEILLTLSNPDNMHEALLQAIDSGYTTIAEVTLRHPTYLDTSKRMRRMGETDLFFKPERGSQFPSYVTPLNLAAQKNQFVIVQLLLQRGETIVRPHKFDCVCQECLNKNKFDQLRSAKCRLDAYRGLASEAYVSLNSKDPFLTAFELAHELRGLSKSEVFFKKEYTDLADQLSDYVVKLLDRVWTQRELSAVLDKTGPPQEDRFESLVRFRMAVAYQEKLFVSHPNCQQRIDRCWYEGLGKVDRATWISRFGLLVVSILVYPFLVMCFLFAPKSSYAQSLSVPAVKFVSHTASFVIFLVLVIVTSVESIGLISNKNTFNSNYPSLLPMWTDFCQNNPENCPYGENFPLRAREATITEVMVSIWIMGMVLQECQEIWSCGLLTHFSDKFNLLDLVLLSVYIATYTIRFWSMLKFDESLDALRTLNTNFSSNPDLTQRYVYWLNADRRLWDQLDPINMAEGLFALANILSFSRIIYLLPANESLGPLQISLGRMINDILKFFALAVMVITAFMVAMRNLFYYYAARGGIEMNKLNVETPPAVEFYGTELDTFRTVFWTIYGRSNETAVKLGGYNNTMTETIGEVIDGMYNIVMVVLLLNILIAMMSRSFDKIQEDADVEWKFARSVLYMDYITEGRVLPVPLNVIEVPYDIIRYIISLVQGSTQVHEPLQEFHGERRVAFSNIASETVVKRQRNLNGLDEPTPTGVPHAGRGGVATTQDRRKSNKPMTLYQEIVQCIIQRFIYDMQRQNEISGGTTDDIKHHFERMRYEIMSQYKLKDESIAMAMTAVQDITEQIHVLSTDGRLKSLFSDKNACTNSQESVVQSAGSRSDLTASDYSEKYRDILCDVHEQPDDLEDEENEDENGYEPLASDFSVDSGVNVEAVCVIEHVADNYRLTDGNQTDMVPHA